MSLNGLSGPNAAYIANLNKQQQSDNAVSNPPAIQKQDENKKLKQTLAGLGIAGAAIALGAGIYYFKKKKYLIDISNITNLAKPTVSETVEQNFCSASSKADNVLIEHLGNGRIKAVFVNNNINHTPIELPEYLYHFTSKESMDKIISSGTLKISEKEQLKGLYLLDSKNFLNYYQNTEVNGVKKDLLTAIFRQPTLQNGKAHLEKDLVVIKIPMEDLLRNGKLRVRTQKDIFTFSNALKTVKAKTGKNYFLRELCEDSKREEFKKLLVSSGILNQAQCDSFMRNMEIKIHHGYSLAGASANNLENNFSIEYIFNKDIKLSEFPNITAQTINPLNYTYKNKKQIDLNKAKTIFEGIFMPVQTK